MIITELTGLETKFCRFGPEIETCENGVIAGYASLFGEPDQGGDVVQPGAYADSLSKMAASGGTTKMLWQHDPAQPIGIWDEVREDGTGLFVRGRLLSDVQKGAEALSLIKAGAIDGLSIGYRTIRATSNGAGRDLQTIELWEVSLVTFPMLPKARATTQTASAKAEGDVIRALTAAMNEARTTLA